MNEQESEEQQKQGRGLNINTGISVGLAVMIGGFGFWIKNGQQAAEIERMRDASEAAIKIAQLHVEIANLEKDLADKNRNSYTFSQMYRWTTQLQKTNNEAGIKILVPEPSPLP